MEDFLRRFKHRFGHGDTAKLTQDNDSNQNGIKIRIAHLLNEALNPPILGHDLNAASEDSWIDIEPLQLPSINEDYVELNEAEIFGEEFPGRFRAKIEEQKRDEHEAVTSYLGKFLVSPDNFPVERKQGQIEIQPNLRKFRTDVGDVPRGNVSKEIGILLRFRWDVTVFPRSVSESQVMKLRRFSFEPRKFPSTPSMKRLKRFSVDPKEFPLRKEQSEGLPKQIMNTKTATTMFPQVSSSTTATDFLLNQFTIDVHMFPKSFESGPRLTKFCLDVNTFPEASYEDHFQPTRTLLEKNKVDLDFKSHSEIEELQSSHDNQLNKLLSKNKFTIINVTGQMLSDTDIDEYVGKAKLRQFKVAPINFPSHLKPFDSHFVFTDVDIKLEKFTFDVASFPRALIASPKPR